MEKEETLFALRAPEIGQVTMNIPVKVNLSSYGDTTETDTGDKVTVWTSSGSSFSQIGSFTVPSAGGTVSI